MRTAPTSEGDARRGLVLDDEHALDLMLFVRLENGINMLGMRARAPFLVEDMHVEADALGEIRPKRTELAIARHDDLVAGRQRVVSAASQPPVPVAG